MQNELVQLSVLGFLVGTIGTLIGAGGGFIMVPILLILYPNDPPEKITAISLAVVCINAVSGSIAYAIKGKVDYRSGLLFSLASSPGAIIGAWATAFIARHWFENIFGALLIVLSIALLLRKQLESHEISEANAKYPIRKIVDSDGEVHLISYSTPVGLSISAVVGFMSSLLGIGGGIIHVPALVNILRFPVHIATATSHFTLAIMSLLGSGEHFFRGDLDSVSLHRIFLLAPSVIVGAQLGAYLSPKVKGKWIIKTLAVALLIVGARFVFR